jgi:hypothetical protein
MFAVLMANVCSPSSLRSNAGHPQVQRKKGGTILVLHQVPLSSSISSEQRAGALLTVEEFQLPRRPAFFGFVVTNF